jgi:hypothetical protein
MVQLVIGPKRKISGMVKACPMKLNGLKTNVELNIIPLGSHDCLIGMDWLDQHRVILDCYNKSFTCLDEEGNLRIIQGIPGAVIAREISYLQLKESYIKDFKYFLCNWKKHLRIMCQRLKIV